MDAKAEQLVLDYLRRLGDATQQLLGPGERVAFMARARADIARQLAEHRAGATGDVLHVLGRFGDPRELVARERRRLDEATAPLTAAAVGEDAVVAGGRGPDDATGGGEGGVSATGGQTPAAPGAGGASATGRQTPAAPGEVLTGTPVTRGKRAPGARPPGQRPFDVPRPHRPLTARWRPGGAPRRPGGETQRPGRTPSEPDGLRQLLGGTPRQLGSAPRDPGQASWSPGTTPRQLGSAPRDPGQASWSPGTTPGQPSGTPPRLGDVPDPPEGAERRSGPPPPTGDAPQQPGQGPQQRRGPGPATSGVRLAGVLTLARRHPLETVAVLLLGVGGLIDPFPLWLLGAAAVLISRLWDARDKWAALAVPVGFALVGAIAIAGITARSGSLAGYASTVRIDGWDLIRAGSVAGAAYLAWRVRQGRRPRREPPWRRPPRG